MTKIWWKSDEEKEKEVEEEEEEEEEEHKSSTPAIYYDFITHDRLHYATGIYRFRLLNVCHWKMVNTVDTDKVFTEQNEGKKEVAN